jgi:hypothetical protein
VIIDYSTARPSVATLKAAKVTAVGRYIGWDSVPGYSSIGKNLTAPVARALIASGISIFLAFEYAADAALKGHAQGVADGKLATQQLAALGAPAGMTVYFALDFDIPDYAPASSDPRAKLGPAAAYFDGIHSTNPHYTVGVYGGYYAVKRVLDARLAAMGWQTIAWSGGQRDPRAVLYQTGATTLGGADVNVHEGTAADFGQWPRPATPAHPATPKGSTLKISTPPPGDYKDGTTVVTLGIGPDGTALWETRTSDGKTWSTPVKQ